MKSGRILINIAYYLIAAGWVLAIPVGMVSFFTGGFLVWVVWYGLWDWIRDLKEDYQALERTQDDDAPLGEKIAREVDWGLARARDAHPATIVLHHNGTQDLGNVNGFQDLGYPVHRADISAAYPTQMQCLDCSARFEPPYPRICPFCYCRKFAVPSLP